MHPATVGTPGFFSWLQLLFIGLKVAGIIDWSWWAVFIPTWASLGIAALVLLVLLIVRRRRQKRAVL
jgi:membrane protein implicated in regulation of membrane protease activity